MTEARKSLLAWLERRKGSLQDFVFPSRIDYMGHISTRQYARLLALLWQKCDFLIPKDRFC
jgi:hypothetical protein